MSDERLIDLEIKIAHQERAIEDLQSTVYEQQKKLAVLEKTVERLAARLRDLAAGGPEIGPANDPPPHY